MTAVTAELPRQRFVARRITPSGDAALTKVLFRRQLVVSRTTQRQVRRRVCSSLSKRLEVMELQVARFAAALTTRINVAAASGVTLVHIALQRRRDVPTADTSRRESAGGFSITAARVTTGWGVVDHDEVASSSGFTRFEVASFGGVAALDEFAPSSEATGLDEVATVGGVAALDGIVAFDGFSAAPARLSSVVAVIRFNPRDSLPLCTVLPRLVRSGTHCKLSLLECSDEQLHRLEMQLAQ